MIVSALSDCISCIFQDAKLNMWHFPLPPSEPTSVLSGCGKCLITGPCKSSSLAKRQSTCRITFLHPVKTSKKLSHFGLQEAVD